LELSILKPEKINPIIIEKPKTSYGIIIGRSKPGAVKIDFGKRSDPIIVDKMKNDKLLDIFPVPEEVNVNVIIKKGEKNIPQGEKPVV
jgi:hypothetical protein